MKKIFLIFLLLGSIVLAGCGSDDYEDEVPRVVLTSPSNGGDKMFNGDPISIVFSTAMNPLSLRDSTNFNLVDKATGLSWPHQHSPPDALPMLYTYTPSEGNTTVEIKATNGFLPQSCFLLTVSKNAVSAENVGMAADYNGCFCTGSAVNTCGP